MTFNRVLLLELRKSGLSLSEFIEGGSRDVDGEPVVFLLELCFTGNVVMFCVCFSMISMFVGVALLHCFSLKK